MAEHRVDSVQPAQARASARGVMVESTGVRGIRRATAGIGLIGFSGHLVVQGLVDTSDDEGFYAAALTHPTELPNSRSYDH
jgi:hypothetical protein